MLIIYDIHTKEIKHVMMLISDSSNKIKQFTPKEVFPHRRVLPSNLRPFNVPDDMLIAINIRNYIVETDENGEPVGLIEKPMKPVITLSTDAQDRDNDGIPELLADSKDMTTLIASVRGHDGRLITDINYEIVFTTTHGTLMQKRVITQDGIAKCQFKSSDETVTAEICASANGCRKGKIKIEFKLGF